MTEGADVAASGSRSPRRPGEFLKIQLLTIPGCPNAALARELLRHVLESSRVPAEIEEVDMAAPGTPEALRGWGSPTILIDGVDIEGAEAPAASGCRLYQGPGGSLSGTPPEAILRAAVTRARRSP